MTSWSSYSVLVLLAARRLLIFASSKRSDHLGPSLPFLSKRRLLGLPDPCTLLKRSRMSYKPCRFFLPFANACPVFDSVRNTFTSTPLLHVSSTSVMAFGRQQALGPSQRARAA